MTSPEPARTPLAERLSPVPGPSGINLRPREGKNNVDVAPVGGEVGKSKGGGRGGRLKKRGQAGNPGGSGRRGQAQTPPPSTSCSRGARTKRGGGKKVTFGNAPPHHSHRDKSNKAQAALGHAAGAEAGKYVRGGRKNANPNAQPEALNNGKKV